MIRVIKKFNDLRVVVCPSCGHMLKYENSDIAAVQTEISGEYKYKNEIVCPICSTHIFVK